MHSLRLNPGPLRFARGSFRPSGELHVHGDVGRASRRLNPAAWRSTDTYAARLIIGFSVGDQPMWTLDDLVNLVRVFRTEQGKPDASFLSQRGVYQHREGAKAGQVVTEDSAQVLIVDVWDTPRDEFVNEIMALAEYLCEAMEQESVIVEFQKNGVTQEVVGVVP